MKNSNFHSCHVLDAKPDARLLWRFSIEDGKVALASEQRLLPAEPLPSKLVGKDWRSLWQRKLNIAWLPAEHAFLRVAHLPASDFAEVLSMVELQLEKLSPLPANQIVWSIEVLPQHVENMQTVVVVIAARHLVEAFLGKLESDGYQPDRLELPQLHQLLATRMEEDGVWIYPSNEGSKHLCLIAWWFGGSLQQLQVLQFPDSLNRGTLLVEQLTKAALAGEMEGWLTSRPRCHLVADAATSAFLEPSLKQWAEDSVVAVEPLSKAAVAELAAKRSARNEAKANLLPVEYTARYQQKFIDRLWMSGLGGIVAAYIIGVAIYFASLQVLNYQQNSLEKEVASLSPKYTNAMKLKERVEVLQNQLNLKYAALDSLRAASELLPPDLSLSQLHFQKGQKLFLQGTAPQEQVSQLTDYNSALRKATANGELLFSKVEQPRYDARGQTLAWRFTCDLNRTETE